MTEQAFVTLGEDLPDITLPDLDGRPRPLREQPGTKLLAFLWASW